MPRPNRARSIASEDNLARRITYEREQRGWSYAGLAQRMTAQGCAIDQSALYKVEKGSPRRRISVDELVAISEVFALPMTELLAPPELMAERQVLSILERYRQARAEVRVAQEALYDLLKGDDHVKAALEQHLTMADIPPLVFSRSKAFQGHTMSQELGIEILNRMIARYEAQGRGDIALGLTMEREAIAAGWVEQ